VRRNSYCYSTLKVYPPPVTINHSVVAHLNAMRHASIQILPQRMHQHRENAAPFNEVASIPHLLESGDSLSRLR